MPKRLSILVALVIAGLAFGAGAALPMFKEQSKKNTTVDAVAYRYPDVDLNSCRELPLAQVPSCLDGVLAGVAVSKKSSAICSEIQQPVLRENCINRISFGLRLADASKFCAELSSDPLCVDLAAVLQARLENKRDPCFTIASAELRSVCTNMFAPADLPPAQTPSQGDTLPQKKYGLVCIASDKACLAAQPDFNAAVSAQSEAQCRELGIYSELCLNEVALYRSYQARTTAACSIRLPQEICQLQLAVALALDGDAKQCEALANAQHKEACDIELKEAQGQKRFGYLVK